MPLDPQIQAVLEAMASAGIRPVQELTPSEAREQFDSMVKARSLETQPIGDVVAREVPGAAGPLPARVYTPLESEPPAAGAGLLPRRRSRDRRPRQP